MPRPVLKWMVKLRMWYADIRGHHGKKWDYEPSEYYMGKKRKNDLVNYIYRSYGLCGLSY